MSFAGFLSRLHGQPESYAKRIKYKFGRTLGAGSYGVVREAEGPSGTCAVKIILKKTIEGREDMVYEELDLLQRIHHPHIVQFVDWFESKDKFYILMQLATGGELFDRISEQGKFTEKDAAATIKEVMLAVDYLHQNQIVHRDLKPENLLYLTKEPDSHLVIADFGIAKVLGKGETLNNAAGSFGYAAPEAMCGESHGKPVDLWSMGVITYILLCGYQPFRSENIHDLLRECRSGPVVFHRRYWENVSDDAKDFIQKLLNPEPELRLTSEQALAHPWLSGQNASDHDLLPEIRAFRARSRFRRLIEKIKLHARIQKLREQEDDPDSAELAALFHEVAKAKITEDKEEKEILRITGESR